MLEVILGFEHLIRRNVYLKCGRKFKIKYIINISKVSSILGTSTCEVLIVPHVITGCDSVSTFEGKGKFIAFKEMTKDLCYQATFTEMGQLWQVSEDFVKRMGKFVCEMHKGCFINK